MKLMKLMKFEIDEVWKNHNGELWIIKDFQNGNYPIIAHSINWQPDSDIGLVLTLTKTGQEMNNNITSPYDLVELVGHIQDFPEYQL